MPVKACRPAVVVGPPRARARVCVCGSALQHGRQVPPVTMAMGVPAGSAELDAYPKPVLVSRGLSALVHLSPAPHKTSPSVAVPVVFNIPTTQHPLSLSTPAAAFAPPGLEGGPRNSASPPDLEGASTTAVPPGTASAAPSAVATAEEPLKLEKTPEPQATTKKRPRAKETSSAPNPALRPSSCPLPYPTLLLPW